MSFRRSLSFAEDEKEILDYFDNNGKSDVAKLAMIFYRDNKDKLMIDDIKQVIELLNQMQINLPSQGRTQATDILKSQLNKLKK